MQFVSERGVTIQISNQISSVARLTNNQNYGLATGEEKGSDDSGEEDGSIEIEDRDDVDARRWGGDSVGSGRDETLEIKKAQGRFRLCVLRQGREREPVL